MKAESSAFAHQRGALQRLDPLAVGRAQLDHVVAVARRRSFRTEGKIVPGNIDGAAVFDNERRVDSQLAAPVFELGARLARTEDQRTPHLAQLPDPRFG